MLFHGKDSELIDPIQGLQDNRESVEETYHLKERQDEIAGRWDLSND